MFDEIEGIKMADTGGQHLTTQSEDLSMESDSASPEVNRELRLKRFEFTLEEDLPVSLRPISLIMESVYQLEDLKEKLRPRAEMEREYLTVLSDITKNNKIYSCSHSLELLLNRYTQLVERDEVNSSMLSTLEKENFNLKHLFETGQEEIAHLKGQVERMSDKLRKGEDERKLLQGQLNYIKKQRDEVNQMQE